MESISSEAPAAPPAPGLLLYLNSPTQLARLLVRRIPSSRYEFLRADRRVLCDDVWLASWLEVDRHGFRSGLRDDDVVVINYNSQASSGHALGSPLCSDRTV